MQPFAGRDLEPVDGKKRMAAIRPHMHAIHAKTFRTRHFFPKPLYRMLHPCYNAKWLTEQPQLG
jgi:hypothetical protein